MPTTPPRMTLPAKPAAPVGGTSLISGITCGSYPSLLMVTVISALRLATTTQGVTQEVGLLSPDNSAVAPGGVDTIEIFSVVPREIDAQPQHGSTSAAANRNLIIRQIPPSPAESFPATP